MSECILPIHPRTGLRAVGLLRSGKPVWPVMGASPDDPSNEPAAASEPQAAASEPSAEPTTPAPLHEDPAIAKALEGLSPEQRETLLTTGGKNALAARGEEAKAAKKVASQAQASAEAAATKAREELAQTVGKALGLIKDDEKLDPAKLAEQLNGAQAQVKQTQVELAVYQAAASAGANANALLDSRSFLNKIASLEPSDNDGITAAIAEAVASNKTFALAAPAAAVVEPEHTGPKPNPAQGSSGSGAPTIDDQIAAARKDGNLRLAIHLENQKLLPQGR